jgi:hypothetical protein
MEGVNAVEEFEEEKVQAFDMPIMYTAYEEQETCYIADNWFSK